MKAVVAAFNQEKALVGAFSVITTIWMDLRFKLLVKGLGRSFAPTLTLRMTFNISSQKLPTWKVPWTLWVSSERRNHSQIVKQASKLEVFTSKGPKLLSKNCFHLNTSFWPHSIKILRQLKIFEKVKILNSKWVILN